MRQRKVAACWQYNRMSLDVAEGFVAELLSDFREARNIAGSMGNRQDSGYIEYLRRLKGIKRERERETVIMKPLRETETDRQ